MELRHLNGFVAVAEELNFGRAAARLHLSQPAVSRAMIQLEDELGVALIDRSTHHVGITPAGQAFLREARTVLGQVEVAAQAARQAPETTMLRIGHTECTEELIPPILRTFRRRMPSLRLDVRQIDRLSQPRWLCKGEVDVTTRRAPTDDAGLDSEQVGREPIMLALPAGHPLAEEEKVAVAQLADVPFVALPGTPSHRCLATMCEAVGFTPTVAEEASTLTSLTVLVASGVGAAVVPASISGRFNSGGVVYRPFEGRAPTLPVMVAWRRDDPSPAVQGFLGLVRAIKVSSRGRVRLAGAVEGYAEHEERTLTPSGSLG